MTKPPTDVVWPATGHIVEPSGAKKTQGWLGGEKPSAEFLNWLFSNLGLWTTYLKNLELLESLSWVESQVFEKDIGLGSELVNSEAQAVTPRLTVEAVSSSVADYTCVARFGTQAYVWAKGLGSTSALSITVNAVRSTDGSDKWQKVTNSQSAFMLQVSRDGLSFSSMPLAQNTAWTDAFIDGDGTASGWGRQLNVPSAQGALTDGEQDLAIHSSQVNATSERRLLWTIKGASNSPVRLYYNRNGGALGGSPGFEVSINCSWGNATNLWTHDVTGIAALYRFDAVRLSTFIKPSAAAGTTFTDTISGTEWTNSFNLQHPSTTAGTTDHTQGQLDNGHIKVLNTKASDLDDANPPATTAQANKIGVRNVDKVSAYATTDNAGNVTLNSGYNMTSVAIGSDVFTFTFNADFDDANYEATATVEIDDNTACYTPNLFNKLAGSIKCRIMKQIGAVSAPVDLDTVPIGINLRISGKQTT